MCCKDRARIRKEEKRSDRLLGATETRGELAQWRTLQQKNSNPLGVAKG